MIAGHRWEYDAAYRGWRCVGLPYWGVECHQWCIGCGCLISALEVEQAGLSLLRETDLTPFLDMFARRRGFAPIEAGTFAADKFRSQISNSAGEPR